MLGADADCAWTGNTDRSVRLPEQFHDRCARGQGTRDAAGVLWVVDGNAEGMVDGCGQLLGTDRIAGRIFTVLVGLAVDASPFDAGSRQD